MWKKHNLNLGKKKALVYNIVYMIKNFQKDLHDKIIINITIVNKTQFDT